MTPQKPYLLRAIYEWLLDNETTPQLVIDPKFPEVKLPQDLLNQDYIILNISPDAIRNLEMTNEYVFFDARFQGAPYAVELPMICIEAILARENNQGLAFAPEEKSDDDPNPPEPPVDKSKKPNLKIVK